MLCVEQKQGHEGQWWIIDMSYLGGIYKLFFPKSMPLPGDVWGRGGWHYSVGLRPSAVSIAYPQLNNHILSCYMPQVLCWLFNILLYVNCHIPEEGYFKCSGYWSGSRTTFSNAIDPTEKLRKFWEKKLQRKSVMKEHEPGSNPWPYAWESRVATTAPLLGSHFFRII